MSAKLLHLCQTVKLDVVFRAFVLAGISLCIASCTADRGETSADNQHHLATHGGGVCYHDGQVIGRGDSMTETDCKGICRLGGYDPNDCFFYGYPGNGGVEVSPSPESEAAVPYGICMNDGTDDPNIQSQRAKLLAEHPNVIELPPAHSRDTKGQDYKTDNDVIVITIPQGHKILGTQCGVTPEGGVAPASPNGSPGWICRGVRENGFRPPYRCKVYSSTYFTYLNFLPDPHHPETATQVAIGFVNGTGVQLYGWHWLYVEPAK